MKKLLLFLAVLVLIVILGLVALLVLVNPNQFKPLFIEQTKKKTGLELVIDGDISWQFFPSLGFELGKTELKNPEGFSQANLLKVDKVGVDISVMPLLSHQLEMGNITLNGAELNLETLPDGRRNIDALQQHAADDSSTGSSSTGRSSTNRADNSAEQTANSEPTSSEQQPWPINIAGVTIDKASLLIVDQQAGSSMKLHDIALNLSEFAFDSWTTAQFALQGERDQQAFGVQGSAEFTLADDFQQYALRNVNLDANFSDGSTQIDTATLTLDHFAFDQIGTLSYAVKGQANAMALDIYGSGNVKVDQALTAITVQALTLDGDIEGANLPQSPMTLTLRSDIGFDLAQNHLTAQLQQLAANDLRFDGQAQVTLSDIPQIRFALHSSDVDLDALLGETSQTDQVKAPASGEPSENAATASTSSTDTTAVISASEQEPDLSVLRRLDIQGDITLDRLKAANMDVNQLQVGVSVQKGVAKLTGLNAQLYEGKVSATAMLDARQTPATYTLQPRVEGVQIQPLLKAVADNDKLEGAGTITADLQGTGLTPSGIKQNLAGKVAIQLADGAINGINVAQMIREGYAKFKGKPLDGTQGVQKTDFSALSATLSLKHGVVSTQDLHLQSPLLRVSGQGEANVLQRTLDVLLRTSLVKSLAGQGGKDIDELRDVTIPLQVSGAWKKPKFKLVFDDILKEKARKELDRNLEKINDKLDDKIKDENTKKAINHLLDGLFR